MEPLSPLPPASSPTPRSARRKGLIAAVSVAVIAGLVVGAFFVFRKQADKLLFSLKSAVGTAISAASDTKFEAQINSTGADGSVTVKLDGEFDADTNVTQVQTDIGKVIPGAPSGSLEVVGNQSEKLAYVLGASLPGADLGGKKWIVIDPAKKQAKGADLAKVLADATTNPLGLAAAIDPAAAKSLGRETLRGESVEHLQVDIPSSDVLRLNPQLAAFLVGKQVTLPPTLTYDVFVTQDNRIRRMATTVTIGEQKIDLVVRFPDVAQNIALTAPDKANSVPFDQVVGQLGSGLS